MSYVANALAEDEQLKRSEQAHARLMKGQSFSDCMELARGFQIGREQVLKSINQTKPEGRAYNEAFSGWLERRGWHKIDSNTTTSMFWCLEHLVEIEQAPSSSAK